MRVAGCVTAVSLMLLWANGLPWSMGDEARDEGQPARSTAGLVALYDFAADDGELVRDRSGAGTPLDLRIEDLRQVRRSRGTLEITGETQIRSTQPPQRLIDAIQQSGELAIEVWVHPDSTDQTGPARIVSLAEGTSERNVTLGQDGGRFDVRLRTTKTSSNGLPSLSTKDKSLQTKLVHVVYTRNRSGQTQIYVDGKRQVDQKVDGTLANWDGSYQLVLGNEIGGGRTWRGTYHLVAIYNRHLSPGDVSRHYQAGPDPADTPKLAATADSGVRATNGLVALYDFAAESGPLVADRSGAGAPLNLQIGDEKSVKRSAGRLEVVGPTTIQTQQPPSRLIEAIRRSGEASIEAWIAPAKTDQQGPARIVSLSRDANVRNMTLGQDGSRFDVRFRTSKTSDNGIPSVASDPGSLRSEMTHVAYTRDRSGRTRLYLDGRRVAEQTVAGQTTNWDGDFQLSLANEVNGGRPWLGTYHLVAIYSRDLKPEEVQEHFRAGPLARRSVDVAAAAPTAKQLHFRDAVAPILARHCLECHDSAVKEGGLDLSRHEGLLAGSENGKVLVPGESARSRLWETVDGDEMPSDRPPLSPDEKAALRRWIDDGAVWSIDVIDPALYAHSSDAGENWLRRLTRFEYVATVRGAVGVDISQEASDLLPRDLRADGFSNTAYNLGVDLKHVEAYARLATIIVERMDVLQFADRFSKKRRLTDDDMRDLIEKMGKWLLRGPLSEEEIVNYRGISTTVASAGGDYKEAVSYVIQAMLQSPRFLYRVENQVGDGTAWPVNEYELASRLSYMLWGASPDEQLIQAADDGELFDPAECEAQARRMLADPRAIAHSRQFVAQWLNLDGLSNLSPNRERFPDWKSELAADMRDETLAYFEEIVWNQNRPLSDLLNAQVTFVSPRLARHYGLTPRKDGEWRYDLDSVPGRGGLLTQGSVLTIGGDNASMVSRGLFVLHDLLRGAVKDPPPCVDTTPVPTKPGLTQRAIAEARIADSSCGGCHAKFEPLAFGLEKFDGLGTYHQTDQHGNALRDDGNVLIPGTATPVSYESSAELMDLLANNPRVQESLTWKVTQFAMGRPLTAADAPIVAKIHESAQQAGGTYADLMRAIVMSDLVQTTRTENRQ